MFANPHISLRVSFARTLSPDCVGWVFACKSKYYSLILE